MRLTHLSVLSASVLIAACGGGGGSSFNGAEPPASTFAITSANATAATSASWEAVVASSDFGDLGGSLGLSAAIPGSVAKATQALKVAGQSTGAGQAVPVGPNVLPCLAGGAVTVSGDVASLLTLTPGDNFDVLFELCDEGAGEVVDGAIAFTVSDFSGDLLLGTYLLSMDGVLTDLQVATGTDTFINNGDATTTLDTLQTPFVATGVSGTSMTVDANASSQTLSNYVSSSTLDGGMQNLPYTMAASGTLDTTQLGGVVEYSTPVEFSGEGTNYPAAGSLLVEGSSSSARLTAVDDVNVTIEVDTNGDGVVDETINTTWAALVES
jgi:hypothetical protein